MHHGLYWSLQFSSILAEEDIMMSNRSQDMLSFTVVYIVGRMEFVRPWINSARTPSKILYSKPGLRFSLQTVKLE